MAEVAATFTANISGYKSAMGKMAQSTTAATGKISKMRSSAMSIAKGVGAVALVSKGIGVLRDSVGSAVARFDTLNAYPRVMKQMGYSTSDTNKSVGILKKGIDGLPTSLQDITRNAQNFAILEHSASKGAETATALNDAFLASGASAGDASRGVQQYSQMLATGKVDMQSWRTLQETMPYALTKVARSFGLTGKSAERDLYAKLKSGEITMDELNSHFVKLDGGAKGFAKTARSATGGIGTSFTNMRNAVTNGITDMLTSVDNGLKQAGTGGIAKIFDQSKIGIKSAFKSINSFIQASIPVIVGAFKEIYPVVKTFASAIKSGIGIALNVLKSFASWINSNSDWLGPLAAGIATFVAAVKTIRIITSVVGWIQGTITILSNLGGAIKIAKGIWTGFTALLGLGPWGIVIAAIAAVVTALVLFFTKTKTGQAMWSAFVSFLSGLWNGIVSTAKTVWGGLSSFFTGLWTGIVTVSTTVWNTIVTFLSGLWNGIVTTAKTTWGILSSFFTGLWTAISTVATTVWNTIKTTITTLWNGIVTTAKTVWNGLSTFFSSLWSGISSIISGAWELIKSIVLGAILIVLDLVTGNFKALKNDISLIWNGIKSGLASIWNGIKSVATTVFNVIKNGIVNIWNGVKSVTSSVWNGIKSFLSGLWNGIKHLASSTWNGLKSAISNTWNGIKSVTSSVWNGIKSFLSGLWNGIKHLASSTWNGLKSSISNAWNGIKSMTSSVWNGIKHFMSSVWNGIKSVASNAVHGMGSSIRSAWNGIKSFASNLWNGVKSTIQRAMHFDLGAAGRAIMDSFFIGLQAAWGKVKSFVGGIASWVRKHKGPISYDAKLLIPAGKAMMNGLNSGLMNSFSTVQHNVSGMADKLSDGINSVAGDIKTGDLSMQAASYQGGSIDQNIDTDNWVKPTYIVHNELVGDKIRTIVSQGQADDQVSSKFFMS